MKKSGTDGDSHRTDRVAGRVREEISRALQRKVGDPRLANVIVSRVEITSDLQIATVWIRLVHGDGVEARRRALQGLRAARGLLRTQACARLGLRRTPELRFGFDEGVDALSRVEELLNEIERERKERA